MLSDLKTLAGQLTPFPYPITLDCISNNKFRLLYPLKFEIGPYTGLSGRLDTKNAIFSPLFKFVFTVKGDKITELKGAIKIRNFVIVFGLFIGSIWVLLSTDRDPLTYLFLAFAVIAGYIYYCRHLKSFRKDTEQFLLFLKDKYP